MENVNRVNEFLNETGVFFLATVEKDQPRLRPLGMHMMIDGKLLFGIGNFKDVYRQLCENPKCEIAAVKKDGHWLRYTGTAVFEDDPKYAETALNAAPHLKAVYNEETGNKMMIFRLEDATAVDIHVMGKGEDLLN
ncbi:MAG: pyridoxamine 5'-phosphate oxidase family protein [Lachnospiraceae bacterium]|nr:pyridoxamine 5'-phosphate oxidase family protein [Lachnospiraceae bacterium]